MFNLACYLQELTVIDSHMREWTPSKIAASSIYFAKKMLQRELPWCGQMQLHSGYTLKQVRECARAICIILNRTTKKKQNKLYKAITDKFKTTKFLGVAYIPARMRQEAYSQQRTSEEADSIASRKPTKDRRDPSDARMDSAE